MAEFIRLAPMPKGKAFKTLSLVEREYIDYNYKYEPKAVMANTLGVSFLDVNVYCSNKGYATPRYILKKPKQIAKDCIFDVDNYRTLTI
jgi:hypothetical protein